MNFQKWQWGNNNHTEDLYRLHIFQVRQERTLINPPLMAEVRITAPTLQMGKGRERPGSGVHG